jgi:hypothetical protein
VKEVTAYELTGAGAVLLAAYLGVDKVRLAEMFGPVLLRFPAMTSTDLWNAVKFLYEEEKSVAETARTMGIDLTAIELIQRQLQ